jgi:[acyl-carrier-protein] S-malonyltransferase
MRWALVFSGQGHQHPDMLGWLAPSPLLATLDAAIGADWRQRLALPGDAGHNRRAQQTLTATACAAWAELAPRLPPPALVAGYSVGELAAFSAAGVCEAGTALDLATARAEAMDRAAEGSNTGLLGVAGAEPVALAALCAAHDLELAIRIDPGTAVLGGRREALQAAADAATAQGWRVTPLPIALASHTRWMRAAVADFEPALVAADLQSPRLPLFSNALGRVRDAAMARRALALQLAQTVAWDDCLDAIAAQRVSAVLEIGPGQALARIWNERHPAVPARSADEFRSAVAVVAWLHRQLERS